MKRVILLPLLLVACSLVHAQFHVRIGGGYAINDVVQLRFSDAQGSVLFKPTQPISGATTRGSLVLGWTLSEGMLDVGIGADYFSIGLEDGGADERLQVFAPSFLLDMYFVERGNWLFGPGIHLRYSTLTYEQRYDIAGEDPLRPASYRTTSEWRGMGYQFQLNGKYTLPTGKGAFTAGAGYSLDDRKLRSLVVNSASADIDEGSGANTFQLDGLELNVAYSIFF